jgi:hypothetical protein
MMSGAAWIDAHTYVREVRVDARTKDIELDRLTGKAPNANPVLEAMEARAEIH